MMMKADLDLIEVRHVLGLIPSEELQTIACELISAGKESKALTELSGLLPSELCRAVELFDQGLVELGRSRMANELALREFVKKVCDQIVMKELSPFDGARLIWKIYRSTSFPETHDYDPFIY